MADRPTPRPGGESPGTKIEITLEMIEAAMDVVWRTDIMTPREDELRAMVREIFLTMLETSRKHHREV